MKLCKLEKFLINRGLLEAFEYNLWHYSIFGNIENYRRLTRGSDSLIVGAFTWSRSPQGWDFWMTVEKEWYECLENNIL